MKIQISGIYMHRKAAALAYQVPLSSLHRNLVFNALNPLSADIWSYVSPVCFCLVVCL